MVTTGSACDDLAVVIAQSPLLSSPAPVEILLSHRVLRKIRDREPAIAATHRHLTHDRLHLEHVHQLLDDEGARWPRPGASDLNLAGLMPIETQGPLQQHEVRARLGQPELEGETFVLPRVIDAAQVHGVVQGFSADRAPRRRLQRKRLRVLGRVTVMAGGSSANGDARASGPRVDDTKVSYARQVGH